MADTQALGVRAVVGMRRSAGDPALIRLPRSRAVIELLRNSFNHFRDPAAAVKLLAHEVARRRGGLRSCTVGEPKATALLLASHFGA